MKMFLILLLSMLALNVSAQIYSNPNPTLYGIMYDKIKALSVFHIPHLTDISTRHTNDTTAQLGEYNGQVYMWTEATHWQPIGSGGGSDGSFTIVSAQALTGISNRVTISHTLTSIPKRFDVQVDNDEGFSTIAPYADENNIYIDYNVAPICNCTYTLKITPETP